MLSSNQTSVSYQTMLKATEFKVTETAHFSPPEKKKTTVGYVLGSE